MANEETFIQENILNSQEEQWVHGMWALTPPSQLPPRWGWWTLHFQGSLPLPPAPSQGQWYLAGMGRLSACLIHPKDQRLLTALPSCRYPSPKAWVSCRENPPLSLIPAPGTYNCPNNSEKNGIKMKDSKTAWLRNPPWSCRNLCRTDTWVNKHRNRPTFTQSIKFLQRHQSYLMVKGKSLR